VKACEKDVMTVDKILRKKEQRKKDEFFTLHNALHKLFTTWALSVLLLAQYCSGD